MREDHVARWWTREPDGRILCGLCPRSCRIPEGARGFCHARENRHGTLLSLAYGRATGFAVDPIEKKPFAHYRPGSPVLSFGTVGCNLCCRFCQNWSLSRAKSTDRCTTVTPEEVVELAKQQNCPGIAYTYNEPIIWSEFVSDCARIARREGIFNVLVTNGYLSREAMPEVMEFIDAANIDLKGFTDRFYRDLTGGRIDPVKETLRWTVQKGKIWTEITTLLIPGENDSEDEISRECEWIVGELGEHVPIHFTAFHPDFELLDRPPTSAESLLRARDIAFAKGLKHAFVGNVLDEEGHSTRCPGCSKIVIRRNWHEVLSYDLAGNRCRFCQTVIAGVFDENPPREFFGRKRRFL